MWAACLQLWRAAPYVSSTITTGLDWSVLGKALAEVAVAPPSIFLSVFLSSLSEQGSTEPCHWCSLVVSKLLGLHQMWCIVLTLQPRAKY